MKVITPYHLFKWAGYYTMNPDGGPPTRLTYSGDGEFSVQPTGLPTISKIALSVRGDSNVDIYVMRADGSMVQRLTNNPGEAVSPHGRQTVPESPSHGDDPRTQAESTSQLRNGTVYVMKADGTGQKTLTTAGNNTDPDGRRIANSLPSVAGGT